MLKVIFSMCEVLRFNFFDSVRFQFFPYDVYYKRPTAYYLRLKKMLFTPCELKLGIFVRNEDCFYYSEMYEKVEKFQGIGRIIIFFLIFLHFRAISFMKQKKGFSFLWRNERILMIIKSKEHTHTHIKSKEHTHTSTGIMRTHSTLNTHWVRI